MAGLTLATLDTPTIGLLARGLAGAHMAHDEPLLWYLTRTTAVAAYIALTFSVLLGSLRSIARSAGERLSWVIDELHAFIATLTGLLVVSHLTTLKLDPYIPFSFTNLFAPGDQPYRPLAVNLGVVAFYAIAIILLTSWLRRLMPYRMWRLIHYVSFIAFALVTAHGLLAGSDVSETWQRALYGAATGAVAFVLLMRLISPRHRSAKEADM